ncbi:glycosyltransferase family 4 protein [Silvimonas amylolytica]|uniref:Glycosyl transferase family 1 n=1 Tax=Silvimonas amylolytica TaxID=449663 RepID=A0ABQ2PIK0_9NEIS|nr:glycosyltransferase family 1 protein [Silvimonas amylolytica]GGP25429.1 glycosyl transferase family 1 [Silvimonas amylolytica]
MRVGIGTTVLERALATSGHVDGIGTYTEELLRYLPADGVETRPLAFLDAPAAAGSSALQGSFKTNVLRSAVTPLSFAGTAELSRKIDIFHATDHYIPKLSGIPLVATLMDPVPLMRSDWVTVKRRWLKNWLFKRSASWADHYITISDYVVGDLVEHFRIPRERITPIHLGVDERYFGRIDEARKQEVLTRLGLRPGFLLFVGTLQPRKNVGRVIDAFESLPAELQKVAPLVVAGRHGWSAEAEVERLKSIQARGAGHWLDYVTDEEKQVLLQSASALVFPSLYEGFGLPVLEAFASGLPVITSTVTSLPEVAGDAALLVDPERPDAIADAISRVLQDPALASSLSERGLARAQTFTWAETARRTAAVYRQLVS